MKKILSYISIFLLLTSININAKTNVIDDNFAQSCFSFYHGLFHEYYGGINLDNVADFNYLVAQCQAMFE